MSRPSPRAPAVLLVVLLLAGCGGPARWSGPAHPAHPAGPSRASTPGPSMESAVDRLARVQVDLVHALGRRVGARGWYVVADGRVGLAQGTCEEGAGTRGGETRAFPNLAVRSGHTGSRRDVFAVVETVTARHGFGPGRIIGEDPGSSGFTATDAAGDRYEIEVGDHRMALGVKTGCYRWRHYPGIPPVALPVPLRGLPISYGG